MKLLRILLLAACLIGLAGPPADAGPTLFEWGLNVDGTVTSSPVPGLNTAGFDFTTGLGTLTFTYDPGAAGSYFVGLFVDHEIDEEVNTYFNEYGVPNGSPAAGQTWEIDEPGFVFGDIYGNFQAGALDNTTGVPEADVDDVSMALGWTFILGADERSVISFHVGVAAPTTGFYLTQTDPDSLYSLFFSSHLTIEPSDGVIPEPGSLLLMGTGLAGMVRAARRRKR